MATLSGTWYSRNRSNLTGGIVLQRKNVDNDDLIRIDNIGIIFYDSNDNWIVDSTDIILGSLVNTSALAQISGVFTQESDNPNLFKFGADSLDQNKGLMVIFNQTFLKGLPFKELPVVPKITMGNPAEIKSKLERTLTNKASIDEYKKANLDPISTVTSPMSVQLKAGDGANVELTGKNNSDALGTDESNIIVGNQGSNTLDGGEGNDILLGGDGNDLYIIDSIYDAAIELKGEGNDTIKSSVSFTLPANIENLDLTGEAKVGSGNELDNKIYGTSQDNILYGLSGNDLIDGRGGADVMYGGPGNDTYFVDSSGDIIIEKAEEGTDSVYVQGMDNLTFKLPINVEKLFLTEGSKAVIIGNSLSNDLWGDEQDNIIYGDENVNFPSDDHIQGGEGNDTLYGMSGNDYLNGGIGADIMYGGRGNDVFIVDNLKDQVVENRGQGYDLVQSYVNFTLPDNVEGLSLLGFENLYGIGNNLNNVLAANDGIDILTGLGGMDIFAFRKGGNRHHITDFSPLDDKISISQSGFNINAKRAQSLQVISKSEYLDQALQKGDLFVYDAMNGNLYVNQSGQVPGLSSGVLVTVLDNKPAITIKNLGIY